MMFTDRQRLLLANLDRITGHKKASGKWGFFLINEDCTVTINSLIVKRAIMMTPDGKRLRLSEKMGPMSLCVLST